MYHLKLIWKIISGGVESDFSILLWSKPVIKVWRLGASWTTSLIFFSLCERILELWSEKSHLSCAVQWSVTISDLSEIKTQFLFKYQIFGIFVAYEGWIPTPFQLPVEILRNAFTEIWIVNPISQCFCNCSGTVKARTLKFFDFT